MIVVKVELHSAITGARTELARMEIANDGQSDNPNRGDYMVRTLRGRNTAALDRRKTQKQGVVKNHARLAEHVWNLVAKALTAMEYGKCNSTSTRSQEPISSASPASTKT